MSPIRSLRILVRDGGQLGDVVLKKDDAGRGLSTGLRELISESSNGREIKVTVAPSAGFADDLREFESVERVSIDESPDVIILDAAGEVEHMHSGNSAPRESISRIEAELTALIEHIKSNLKAHILIANLSTVDPQNPFFTLKGQIQEPFSLLAHRLNLMLIRVSHATGISIVDVDRRIAETGGSSTVTGPGTYSAVGSQLIRDEILRVIQDYGFLDDRPLMEQLGAKPGGQR
jgi:hypothetical protein